MISGRPGRPHQPFLPFQLARVDTAQVGCAERPAVRPHNADADKQAADLFPGQAARAQILECTEVKGDHTLQGNRSRTRIEGTAKLFNG